MVRAQQSDISQIGTWARTAGGAGNDRARSQAIDKDQNIYVAGQFENSAAFKGGPTSITLTSRGGSDIFVAKYDKCGNLLWAKAIGDDGEDIAKSIVVDDLGNFYITGYFENIVDFNPGTGTNTLSSTLFTRDAFFGKYDKNGNYLWAKKIGGMFLTDESLAEGFRSTTGSLSAGYHQSLDRLGVHSIGTGIMGTFSNRIVDFNRLTFGTQFTSGGFDPSLPSGEYFPMGLKPYFDVNAGMVYSYNDGENSMYLGSSVYHAGKPRFSLFQDSVSRIPRRYTIHGGANFYLERNKYHRMIISGIYMQQAKATELTLGMAYGHYIGNEYDAKYVYMGAFYRKGDAIYPYVSLQMNDMQIGLSYDVNTSRAKNIAPRYGSIELTFIYTKPDDREQKRLMPWNY